MDYNKFVMESALFHIKKAQEIMIEGSKDPEAFYKEEMRQAKIVYKTLPFLAAVSILSDP